MGVVRKSVRRRTPSMGSRKKKSFSRSGSVAPSYTQKTKSGIRIRVRGHIRKGAQVNRKK